MIGDGVNCSDVDEVNVAIHMFKKNARFSQKYVVKA